MSTGAKLTWAVIAWLLAAILLLFIAVMDAQASDSRESLLQFRGLSSAAQVFQLSGIFQLTRELGMVCRVGRSVGEYQAALTTRDFDLSTPWVRIMGRLWNEDGCRIPDVPEKPNA